MAAVTINTAAVDVNGIQMLEDVSVTDGAGMGGDAKTRAVRVPTWATKLLLWIFYNSAAGTTPSFAFTMGVPDFSTAARLLAPTDDTDIATLGNAAWNGITALTGAGPYQVVVEVGPDVTDDDTGSASASCYYGVK